jgi:hypothetical protein
MLENQFIQLSASIDPIAREIPIPIKHNALTTYYGHYYSAESLGENDFLDTIEIVTPGGKVIDQITDNTVGMCIAFHDLSKLAPCECFRIKETYIINGSKEEYYSNILRREPDDTNFSVVKYLCYQPAFGFPFAWDETDEIYEYIQQLMPINLHSPQYKQEDKVYTKINGEQVVLFASITKEYEGETDYIPMEWHEKILMALSCDEVYINGERVTKSGNYEIDHDNCTYSDCGIKLMRATFKVTTNVTQRNSNY